MESPSKTVGNASELPGMDQSTQPSMQCNTECNHQRRLDAATALAWDRRRGDRAGGASVEGDGMLGDRGVTAY